jgi:hypothetical protein
MKQEKRVVQMADGRNVDFGKSAKVIKDILTDSNGAPIGIRFDGDNGDTFTALFDQLPDAEWIGLAEPTGISLYAMAHGYVQKLGDTYASLTTAGDCLEAARAMWKRLCTGTWKAEAREFAGTGLLLEALVLAYPAKTRDQIREILGTLSAAEKLAMQVDPDVKPHYDALVAMRARLDNTAALKAKFQ